MADINKVWVSGVVINDPTITRLPSKTAITTFTLQISERFQDRNGVWQTKSNLFSIESLGRSAETTFEKVKKGARYTVDGYLRQDIVDGTERIKVRTFAVYADDSDDTLKYNEGLKRALEIIRKSRDLAVASQKIQELLETEKPWTSSNIIAPTGKT